MYKKWTKEEEKLLLDLYKEKSIDELATILNKDRFQILSKGQRMNIIFMNCWTDEEDEYVKKHYLDMTYSEIADVLNRTKSAVQSRCRKLGLLKSVNSFKKQINSDYFENIDTEEKAYWLGFICADGCVSYNKNSKAYQFKITLQRSDSEFLKKFIIAINGNFEIKEKTTNVKFGDEIKTYEICEVSLKDKKFTSDLLKYFSPNKTEYLRIPSEIPNDLIRHFIRGFSDGDGCFYCNYEKKDKSYEIVGKCYDMLDDIRKELEKENILSKIYKKRQTNFKLGIYQLEEIIKFQSYLYKDATIFMERKYKKSQEILKLAS